MTSRLPALGPRGEGWVLLQLVLLAAIGAGGLAGLAWPEAWRPAALLVGSALILVGGLLGSRAAWDVRKGLSPFPRPLPGAPLVRSGVYRLIRHPIYAGILLAGVGWSVATGSLVALVLTGLLALLLDAKARREEAWLVEAHPGYRAYRDRTKRFVPWVY